MNAIDILNELKTLGNQDYILSINKLGITPNKCFGVSIPSLRQLAKKIKINHDLAISLWKYKIREAQILASMIADYKQVTPLFMDDWMKDFEYWEICDQCLINLFWKTDCSFEKAKQWSFNSSTQQKRAGFAFMAVLSYKQKEFPDSKFESFFEDIKRESKDDREIVTKGISWALRQIGKKNQYLCNQALQVSEELLKINNKNARWIAKSAILDIKNKFNKE